MIAIIRAVNYSIHTCTCIIIRALIIIGAIEKYMQASHIVLPFVLTSQIIIIIQSQIVSVCIISCGAHWDT